MREDQGFAATRNYRTIACGECASGGIGAFELPERPLKYPVGSTTILAENLVRGCSSVVERHVANVNVVSSTLITRF